ncbi:ATP synthase protein I [Pseudorhodobacter antarcticus]|jgi:ATP synthase protein I|uniref:ATP synthase protein I n=1 Tax=Pseudorhodobacter antarcticus TaxID=1077947 RepID=A0A1H8B208_9RHOB|nr:AtpZ/AtpI family protein [Pseudorhodobacter antarcticus]SEM76776.1 ATP synthase protein I [Pseudorhodobacter antarcticus]
MTEEPDTARLAALEARIASVKGKAAKTSPGSGKVFSQGEVAWRMVIELVSGLLLGLSIGFGLDFLFGTQPIFLVIFVLLGFVAGVRTMMKTAQTLQAGPNKQPATAPIKDEGDNG